MTSSMGRPESITAIGLWTTTGGSPLCSASARICRRASSTTHSRHQGHAGHGPSTRPTSSEGSRLKVVARECHAAGVGHSEHMSPAWSGGMASRNLSRLHHLPDARTRRRPRPRGRGIPDTPSDPGRAPSLAAAGRAPQRPGPARTRPRRQAERDPRDRPRRRRLCRGDRPPPRNHQRRHPGRFSSTTPPPQTQPGVPAGAGRATTSPASRTAIKDLARTYGMPTGA
jgi:hypothetical protein